MRWFFVLCGCITSLCAVEVTKKGLIPGYLPYELGAALLFLPYNPTVLIVGDRTAHLAADIARTLERAAVFCLSSDPQDFQSLREYEITLPNIHSQFGFLHSQSEGFYPYYPALPHVRPYEDFFRFPGSPLKPIDTTRPFLFGDPCSLPAINLSRFCEMEQLSRVQFIQLNCGGHELQILQTSPELVKKAIVVCVKTYHQPVRAGISDFAALDQFMVGCGFELMSHYIYDGVIGDALYVKSKYISAVFRSKEI